MSDQEKSESELLKLRREKLTRWRDEFGVDPFGGAFPDTTPIADVHANFEEGKNVRVAGRLVASRPKGKIVFAHIQDDSGKIQVFALRDECEGDEFKFWKVLDLGDFVGVEGTLMLTKTGEQTVRQVRLTLLSKSLHPLPSKWHGLTDMEQRYRQRYLDLISTPSSMRVFQARSRIIAELRSYLHERGFNEVETPMMQAIAGGAAAEPFVTHHKALDIPLYLRIAPELYLKRLLVGGFTKVFEINRNFRNEGISRKHNPEFTMLEAYWAYADFEQMADMVEGMVCHVAETVCGTLKVGGMIRDEQKKDADESEAEASDKVEEQLVDLTPPWPRKKYADCITDVAGKDWFDLTPAERRARAEKEFKLEIGEDLVDYEVTNQVFEKLVEARQVNPLFVTHLPKELVPLARQNAEDPSVVDVYELIIRGMEISPGYSELNDPIVQRQRLEEQAGEETQKLDEDFLSALEYGMPPAGGIGLGIDRLVMLLTGAESIRDVILFPLQKPKKDA